MNVSEILLNIDDDLSRLRQARALLAGEGFTSSRSRAGRPRKQRTLSAEARARIAAAQKRRWAKQRKQKAAKKAA